MTSKEHRQRTSEADLAGQVGDVEAAAVGRAIAAEADAEQYTPAAVIARQRQIIVLLHAVRALNIALVILFAVFGIFGLLLWTNSEDNLGVARGISRQQRIVICDFYREFGSTPPPELRCP